MNYKKSLIFTLLYVTLLASCTPTNPDEPSTPNYGTLTIDNMVAMREGERDIRIRFSNEEYKEDLTYQYDTRYIRIDENTDRIIAFEEGHEVVVTATSEHFSTEFIVKTDYIYYQPVLNAAPSKLADQIGRDLTNATVFIGDSFFDRSSHWTKFYDDCLPTTGNNVFLTGISSSTLKDWFYLTDYLLYNKIENPKNIVIHLGSNDLWYNCGADDTYFRLKELVTDLAYHYPETQLYFISTENRTYNQVREYWDYRTHVSANDISLSMADSKTELLNFYNLAKNYCESVNNLHFIDSLSYFADSNNDCISSKFKDGCHPKKEEYAYYINALISEGMEGIKNGRIHSTSNTQDINETETEYRPSQESLISNFYLTFDLKLDSINAPKGNMFIDFAFNNASNRFLIWRFNQDDYFYYCGALGGTYHKTTSSYLNYNNSMGSKTIKIGILVSTKHAYLFIDGILRVAFLNLNNTLAMKTSICWMDVEYLEPVVYNNIHGKNVFESKLATLSEYENSNSSSKTYLNF